MTTPKPSIVVGLDGSEVAVEALDWAMAEGECRGYTVEIVTVWRYYEPLAGRSTVAGPGRVDATEVVRPHAGMAELADYIAEHVAAAAATYPRAEYRHVHLGGKQTGHMLVEAADGAAMLVVGSRGTSGVLPALLGSVSAYCVRHAPCPVVVVRAGDSHHRSARHSVAAMALSPVADPTAGPLL